MKPRKLTVSNLKPGQQATLYPSLGYFDARRNCFRALVHGRVFVDGKIPIGARILFKGLKKAMKVTPEEIDSEVFRKRVDGFLATPGKHRRIALVIAEHYFRLRRRSRRNGSFYGTLNLPASAIAAPDQPCTVAMQLVRSGTSAEGARSTSGAIHYVPQRGMSVISDIDDTIKMTGATSRREMLANTFLRPFEVVEGMAELYQRWYAQENCQFHYVSSSPWELYVHLAELCTASNFPAGSMHLRYFRVRDEMFKRFRPIRRNSKVGIIASILKRLPDRKFVLVGDSGEKDPEIYRFIARRFPNHISAIVIRNLAERPLDIKRLKKLGSVAASTRVKIFEQTCEIEDFVSELKL